MNDNVISFEEFKARRFTKQLFPNAQPKAASIVSEVLAIFLSAPKAGGNCEKHQSVYAGIECPQCARGE
jgi:hypothetical protein